MNPQRRGVIGKGVSKARGEMKGADMQSDEEGRGKVKYSIFFTIYRAN